MFIVTQIRNESKRIEEWVKYHNHIIGVEKFIIYDDHSNDETLSILNELSKKYHIITFSTNKNGHYLDSNNPNVYGTIDLHNRILNSMNDGLNFLKKDTKNLDKWIFFIEVDEFIKEDIRIYDYLSTIPLDINRIWIPSYDFDDNFDLNKKILPQSIYRWSDHTRNNNFIGRCKSALRIKNYAQKIVDIHNLDNSKCIRTSGTILNEDYNMVRQDTIGLKLFHYRKPSLLSNFDFFDDSLSKYIF